MKAKNSNFTTLLLFLGAFSIQVQARAYAPAHLAEHINKVECSLQPEYHPIASEREFGKITVASLQYQIPSETFVLEVQAENKEPRYYDFSRLDWSGAELDGYSEDSDTSVSLVQKDGRFEGIIVLEEDFSFLASCSIVD